MIKCNVGGKDRFERIFNGVMFILIGYYFHYYHTNIVALILIGGFGFLKVLTGIFAFCPLYIPINYSTREEWPKKK